MNIKARFTAAIEQTGDPTAPLKLQAAYAAVSKLGALMVSGGANHDKTQDFAQTLLKTFPDEMDHIAADPSFICALSSLLSNAIVAYGRVLTERPKP